MMRKWVATMMVILMVCLAGTVLAVDYWGGPPPGTWERGVPGSTFQLWDFNSPTWTGPDIWDNPYGDPFGELFPQDGWEWGEWEAPPELDPNGFVTGWHCLNPDGGTLTLTIPNTDDPDGVKSICIQLTSSKSPSDVTVSGTGGNPGGYSSGSWSTGRPAIQWPGNAPHGGVWYTYSYGRWISPNPQSETITFTFPYCTVVDQVVVDTICSTDPVANEASTWSRVKALFR